MGTPWWVYLLIILGANYLRRAIVPFGTVPEWADVAIAVAASVLLFMVITAVYRITAGNADCVIWPAARSPCRRTAM